MRFHAPKIAVAAAILFSAGTLFVGSAAADTAPQTVRPNEVRKALVMLPFLSVFDNLNYTVAGDTVVLEGQVTRPSLKSDAANSVKHLKGVKTVVNNIEVLPLSNFDDQIRREAYRRIYGAGPLNRYALNPVAPIRIIVNRGHLTLEGVVANRFDYNLANAQARQVSNAFTVTNNLVIEKETR
jgi:osmotically-inducible protein OsmY